MTQALVTYLRAQQLGTTSKIRRVPPQLASVMCLACDTPLGARGVLVVIGPGGNEEERKKALAGQWYNAVAVTLHPACAGIPEVPE